MGQLATGVAGAVIGSFTPMGAYWGWTIGVAIGTILFPPEGMDQVGPRLGDLTTQTSTSGIAIPTIYGTLRAAGNVIWATDILEKTHVEEFGKGGPSGTSITYSYHGTFAVGVCTGEADVIKIWANGKLIYDISSLSATAPVSKLGLDFTWHRGTEDQLPDSLIESFEGVGQVPAHRGLAYIVFDELPLADYGNGIPRLTFEVTDNAQDLAHSTPAINTDITFNRQLNYYDWTRALNVRTRVVDSTHSNITELSFMNLEGMTSVEKDCPADFPNTTQFDSVMGLLPHSRNLVCRVRDGATPDFYYIEISPDTFTEVARVSDRKVVLREQREVEARLLELLVGHRLAVLGSCRERIIIAGFFSG